ncbi:hypothetical protein E2C01_072883 [Portunus trituberculatus]|uniref:Uncharacterized protein n=1 Tax=Portunus trituberculatus TaxID=210409 RepID=A0A5B7IBV9_PORTR|nr:hypothetical protein [Portunus trituberculatus]
MSTTRLPERRGNSFTATEEHGGLEGVSKFYSVGEEERDARRRRKCYNAKYHTTFSTMQG